MNNLVNVTVDCSAECPINVDTPIERFPLSIDEAQNLIFQLREGLNVLAKHFADEGQRPPRLF